MRMPNKSKLNKIIEALKEIKQYCEKQNGLPYCKNCGIEPKKLMEMIKNCNKLFDKADKNYKK